MIRLFVQLAATASIIFSTTVHGGSPDCDFSSAEVAEMTPLIRQGTIEWERREQALNQTDSRTRDDEEFYDARVAHKLLEVYLDTSRVTRGETYRNLDDLEACLAKKERVWNLECAQRLNRVVLALYEMMDYLRRYAHCAPVPQEEFDLKEVLLHWVEVLQARVESFSREVYLRLGQRAGAEDEFNKDTTEFADEIKIWTCQALNTELEFLSVQGQLEYDLFADSSKLRQSEFLSLAEKALCVQ